jgi:hypothetical protein
MSIRRSRAVWISAAILAVAVAGAALVQLPGAPTTTAATDPSIAAATPGAEPTTGTPQPGTPQPGTPQPGTPQPGTPQPSAPQPESTPAPAEEVPSDETPAAGPPTLPPSEPLPDPVSLPFPDSASATGKLVKGFPTGAVPEAPDSTVTSSSVTAEGSRLQIALSAESSRAVVDVLDFYRTELAKVGMYDTPAPALSGSSALIFARGDHTVTLSATTVEGGCRYVILGSFTAPS